MPQCRFCSSSLSVVFADLGMSPLSNAYVRPEHRQRAETFHPLTAYVCSNCFLVQVPTTATPAEIFSDYAYFSSFSDTWLEHGRVYASEMIDALALSPHHQVVEVASNDGYLLRWFRDRGVRVLGIDPAANVAATAISAGIPTRVAFFGSELAAQLVSEGVKADLLIGNNVLAHVPDLNDFVEGLSILLAPAGTLTMEFPHLLRLIESNQFDTIYHEHFSYFSLATVIAVFDAHGLCVTDVDELPTHGGSLRIHARRNAETASESVAKVLEAERAAGLRDLETYVRFGERVQETKRALLRFLLQAKEDQKRIVGYGAPAKGNTLLNYCGVRSDFLDFTVDRNPHKQGLLLPGTHIEIRDPRDLYEERPDFVLILPWNLRDEIVAQTAAIREWGGKWIVAIPTLTVIE